MPTSHINDVKHWRDRAAEMRMLARMMKDIEAIAIMSRLAAGYDLMADRAAERAAAKATCQTNQRRISSDSFALLTAIRRASSRLSRPIAVNATPPSLYARLGGRSVLAGERRECVRPARATRARRCDA
jgi:hypothetical protein